MKTKSFLAVSIALFMQYSTLVNAQTPVKDWDETYGGNLDEGGSALGAFERLPLQQTADGGYIMGGSSASGISGERSQDSRGGYDYWVVKTGPTGVIQWDARFGGSSDDYLTGLQQTADGGYILSGSSTSGSGFDKSEPLNGGRDFWIVKIDVNGIKEWDSSYGGSGNESLLIMQVTSDGGYILGGITTSAISGDVSQSSVGPGDWWILKVDAYGTKEWDVRYGTNYFNAIYALHQCSDGGYVFGGEVRGTGGSATQSSHVPMSLDADYWVIKTDASGIKQWDKRFGGGGTEEDVLTGLRQSSDGGFILGGYSKADPGGERTASHRGIAGSNDAWIIKIDASGNQLWDVAFGGPFGAGLNSLSLNDADDILLCTSASGGIGYDKTSATQGYWIVKTDANGVKDWDVAIGGNHRDIPYTALENTDGDYAVAGYSASDAIGDKTDPNRGPAGTHDFWLIKLCAATETFYADADNDGYGNSENIIEACSAPVGYVSDSTDCNDNANSIHPNADEPCNNIDDDCDGLIDDPNQNGVGQFQWYLDGDGDGYGGDNNFSACEPPPGYVGNSDDCNDSNPAVHPDTVEICGNEIDDDCDGSIDEDCCNMTVNAGADETTYFGYSVDQCVVHSALISGGTVPFTYSWSLDRPLICNSINSNGDESFTGGSCSNNICPGSGSLALSPSCDGSSISVCLLDTGTVCVTVTDANGCTAMDCFVINAEDVRCFAGNSSIQKVRVCHEGKKTICVDENAVPAHLAHGDYVGSCVNPKYGTIGEQYEWNVYPNPASDKVILEFAIVKESRTEIKITDITGKCLIYTDEGIISNDLIKEFDVSHFNQGTYVVNVIVNGETFTQLLVIQR